MPGSRANTRLNSNSQETLSIDDKLDLLLKDVNVIKQDNQQHLKDMNELKEELRTFKIDINNSLEFCHNQITDCNNKVDRLSAAVAADHELIDKLQSENQVLVRTVAEFKKRLVMQDEYSRCNNLEIQGVPEVKNENVILVVKQVATALNFKLEDQMLDAAHRLAKNPNKPDAPRGIILKFCRRFDMEEMRRKSRVKKSICASELGFESENKIFVNLALGRETRMLWTSVQDFRRRHGYKYAWITGSRKIFLRRGDNQRAILISEKADLDGLE